MASQGIVGQIAEGTVVLADVDPNTPTSLPPESVTFGSDDETVATVVQNGVDPLKCTVALVGVGTTTITSTVDPGQGDPFDLAVDVEARAPEPGEAVSGTFELGAFEPVA